VPDCGTSRALLAHHLLTAAIPRLARPHAYTAVTSSLWVRIRVGSVVWMSLRTVSLFSSRVHRSVSCCIPSGRDGFKMLRVAAPPVFALFSPYAFPRVMACVVDDKPDRDWTMRKRVSHHMRLLSSPVQVECPVPLGESAVPRPALPWIAFVYKGAKSCDGIAGKPVASAPLRRSVTPVPQIVRITQTELLDIGDLLASGHHANRLRHV